MKKQSLPFKFNPLGYSKSGQEMPTSGLTFYQSFENSLTVPNVGNTLTVLGNSPTLTTEDGIKCAYFNGNAVLRSLNDSYYNTSNTEVTLSIWMKFDDFDRSGDIDQEVFAIGKWSARQCFICNIDEKQWIWRKPKICCQNGHVQ